MPCISLPTEELPTLTSPLSATPPPVPPIPTAPDLCCKHPPIPKPKEIPPIPPIVVNAALVLLLEDGIEAILAYKNKIPLKCPKE